MYICIYTYIYIYITYYIYIHTYVCPLPLSGPYCFEGMTWWSTRLAARPRPRPSLAIDCAPKRRPCSATYRKARILAHTITRHCAAELALRLRTAGYAPASSRGNGATARQKQAVRFHRSRDFKVYYFNSMPNLPTNIIPTSIAWLKLSGKSLLDMRIPTL